ncbi:MAG: SAM-dependent methyltransferase [Sciscionella sp.]
MTTVEEAFWLAHEGLAREAPGSVATTALLLRLAGDLPERPSILDIGCGPGPATLELVTETGGTATAIDLHQPFLARLRERVTAAGLGERIHILAADMRDLPLPTAAQTSSGRRGLPTSWASTRRWLPGGASCARTAFWC